jgi:hypothetical protein
VIGASPAPRCDTVSAGAFAAGASILTLLPMFAFAAPDAGLQRLAQELVPLVERAAGARFDEVPVVVLADPEMLAEVVYAEQMHLLAALSDQGSAASEAAAQHTAAEVSHLFAGKYGFLDKRLYISLDAIGNAIADRGADPRLAVPMVQLVLAHELAHALQDQHADLGALVTAASSGDAVMAANCLVEGHAVWIHEAVGAELDLRPAMVLMADLLGYARSGPPDDEASFTTSYVYGLGREFTRWHMEHGGPEHMWTVLRQPPEQTATIVHPERWGDERADAHSPVPSALDRTRRRLSPSSWRHDTQALGDYDVREQLVRAGHGAAADGVEAAWRSRSTGGPLQGVEVVAMRFGDADTARRYVDAMGRQARRQAEASAVDPHVDARFSTFDAVEHDASARESITLTLPHARDEMGTIWLARGADVLQVITVNTTPTDRALRRAMRPSVRSLAHSNSLSDGESGDR